MFTRVGRLLVRTEKARAGFTLVELIAVVAILGLLAALAVPRFAYVLSSSKQKACMANRKLIQNAANLYAANEQNPQQLTAENILTALKDSGYLQSASFTCPVDGDKYSLTGDTDKGYVVTCPNNCCQ